MEREVLQDKQLQCQANPIECIEALPPKQYTRVWNDISVQLVRLDARNKGGNTLSPQDKITAVQLVELKHVPIKRAARILGVHPTAIRIAKRDVRTSLFFVRSQILDKFGRDNLTPEEERIFERLTDLELESQRVTFILKDLDVASVLKPLPHLSYLLSEYSKYLTISRLLLEVDLRPSLGTRKDYYSSSIRSYLFKDNTQQVRKLAQRYLFALWLKNRRERPGKNTDKKILKTIAMVVSAPHVPGNYYLIKLKRFFKEILNLEFERAGKPLGDNPLGLLTTEDINQEECWYDFVEDQYMPKSLLEIIERLIKGETAFEIARAMNMDKYVSKKTIEQWFSAAVNFLENVLLLKNCDRDKTLSDVTQTVGRHYRQVREAIVRCRNSDSMLTK